MKKIYLLFALCTALSLHAQKISEAAAHKLFAERSYVKAAAMYEKVKPNQKVLENLGDSYYNNFQMKDAVRVYGKLFFEHGKDSINPEFLFKYAHALMGTGNYEKADSIMGRYLDYPVDTPKFRANLTRNVPHNYYIQPMAKNTSNGDFGISFYGDKVAFASYRNAKSGGYNWNDKPYLDLYSAAIDAKGQLINVKPFPDAINTKTHESSATFSADGRIMYFNRTSDKMAEVKGEKVANIKIFRAEFKDGKWDNVQAVPFASDNYSTEHPTLSRDGKKLYFASDMPGSIGSFDLYVVDVGEDGTYGTPQNLGDAINTRHREQFPFVSDDGKVLYFASDGHQGMGGLDIFSTREYKGVWAKPINLGETLNSGMDDFGFIVDDSRNTGFLASNRKGSDNLYSFAREDNAESYYVEAKSKTKTPRICFPERRSPCMTKRTT
jgi:hypothetical protein